MLSHPLLNAISHAIGFLHYRSLVGTFGRSPSRQMASADQFSLSFIVYLSLVFVLVFSLSVFSFVVKYLFFSLFGGSYVAPCSV